MARPEIEKDIFISYAHLDNETLTEEQKGWVTTFHHALEKRLGQLLAHLPNIWRDEKLQGNDYFGEEIVDQFQKLRVLVSILSPRYVESDWCRKELRTFYEVTQKFQGVRLGNKSRIFKVIKTPVPHERHPPESKDLLGYEFYEVDDTGRFHEFQLEKQSPYYYKYLTKFEDVAQDLCRLIKDFEAGKASEKTEADTPTDGSQGKTVYLAKTTSDLSAERDNIRRDLELRGYRVLPDQELLPDGHFRQTVQDYLSRCELAVHLIGSKYGLIPEDEERSVGELQDELSRKAGLPRLVWMPVDLKSADARQQQFISLLQSEAAGQQSTELLTTMLEDFKTHLMDTLAKLAAPPQEANANDKGPPRVYLICEEADSEGVRSIDDYLYDQGFEILPTLFEGTETQLREMHKENLRTCNAALIYYNHGTELWVNAKLNDLRKAAGFGRSEPMVAKAVYVSGERNPSKERFRSRELDVIRQFESFSEGDLSAFVAQLKNRQGG